MCCSSSVLSPRAQYRARPLRLTSKVSFKEPTDSSSGLTSRCHVQILAPTFLLLSVSSACLSMPRVSYPPEFSLCRGSLPVTFLLCVAPPRALLTSPPWEFTTLAPQGCADIAHNPFFGVDLLPRLCAAHGNPLNFLVRTSLGVNQPLILQPRTSSARCCP